MSVTNWLSSRPDCTTESIRTEAMSAGFAEELAFRGFGASYLMRQWTGEKSVIRTAWFIAILFGVLHLANLFAGADPGYTLVQVIGATFIGLFLTAVFLRTGNLWVPIAMHVIHDIIAFAGQDVYQDGLIVESVDTYALIDMLLNIGLGIVGLYLIRRSKRGEIRALWDEKWSIKTREDD